MQDPFCGVPINGDTRSSQIHTASRRAGEAIWIRKQNGICNWQTKGTSTDKASTEMLKRKERQPSIDFNLDILFEGRES